MIFANVHGLFYLLASARQLSETYLGWIEIAYSLVWLLIVSIVNEFVVGPHPSLDDVCILNVSISPMAESILALQCIIERIDQGERELLQLDACSVCLVCSCLQRLTWRFPKSEYIMTN